MTKPKIYIPTFDTEYYNARKGLPINLDIGSRCPLQCAGCHRQSEWYDRHRHLFNDMSVKDLQKFVDSKFTFIEFSGQQSDPMAHPNILDFIMNWEVPRFNQRGRLRKLPKKPQKPRRLPWFQKAKKSLSRMNKSYARFIES